MRFYALRFPLLALLSFTLGACQHTTPAASGGRTADTAPSVSPTEAYAVSTILDEGNVQHLAFASDGSYLAYATPDSVRAIDIRGNAPTSSIEATGRLSGTPSGIAFAGGVAVVGYGHNLMLWDPSLSGADAEYVRYRDLRGTSFTGYKPFPPAFALGPEGRYAATASAAEPGTPRLVVWDVTQPQIVAEVAAPAGDADGGAVYNGDAVAFSPDGSLVAVALSPEAVIQIRAVPSGELIREIALDPNTLYTESVAFSPDGSRLAATPAGRTDEQGYFPLPVGVWDVESGRRLHALDTAELYGHEVAFTPDGDYVAAGLDDGVIRFWKLETGAVARSLEDPSAGTIRALAFGIEGRVLVSSSTTAQGGDVRLWHDEESSVPLAP